MAIYRKLPMKLKCTIDLQAGADLQRSITLVKINCLKRLKISDIDGEHFQKTP